MQNVLSIVDSNNTYTPEEKEIVKDTLTKVTELVSSTRSAARKLHTINMTTSVFAFTKSTVWLFSILPFC